MKFDNNSKGFILLIGTILVLYLISKFSIDNDEKLRLNIIQSDYGVAIGIFNEVTKTGTTGLKYIELSYTVDSKRYFKLFESKEYYFKCKNQECGDKKFWIIYMKSHPKRALADLSMEIQGISNPMFPHSLDNFK